MYGSVWMRLAALIALRTWRGASVGGIAVPSGARVAAPATPVGVDVDVVVLPGGPAPPVWASAEADPAVSTRSARSAGATSLLLQLLPRTRNTTSSVGLRG